MMQILIIPLTVVMLMCGFGNACAATDLAAELRHAQKTLTALQYDKAYAEYLRFADKGNSLAQFSVALFFEYGWGRAQDKTMACNWFEKAAQGEIPAANHFWGECLAKGIGRPIEVVKAITWYQRAADLGHFISLCAIADLYMAGEGVKKDPVKAVSLCQQAAKRDIPQAQLRTGLYYLQGESIV